MVIVEDFKICLNGFRKRIGIVLCKYLSPNFLSLDGPPQSYSLFYFSTDFCSFLKMGFRVS